MNKRALITGISGLDGSYLKDYLLKKTKWDLFGLFNTNYTNIKLNNRLELIQCDITNKSNVKNIFKEINPDYVFHLAAQSSPKISFEQPAETLDVNICGTSNILESIKRIEKKNPIILITSSSEIYEKNNITPPVDEYNNFSHNPSSPYVVSKIGTELISRYYNSTYKIKTIILRMFTHTGPGRSEQFAESAFAKQIAMIEKELIPPIIKVGNLSSKRSWLDVRDAVKAYYLAISNPSLQGGTYNVGGKNYCSISDILTELINLSKKKKFITIEVDPSKMRLTDTDALRPNTKTFRKVTGWKEAISLKKTLQDLLNHWRKVV